MAVPLENVEFVPARCPNCGANMQLPESLERAYCIYCGSEFIVSQKTTPVIVTIQDDTRRIENYIKLMIQSLDRGDRDKAQRYFIQAKEIDLDKAWEVANTYSTDILALYLRILSPAIERFQSLRDSTLEKDYPMWMTYGESMAKPAVSDSLEFISRFDLPNEPQGRSLHAEVLYLCGLYFAHEYGSSYSKWMSSIRGIAKLVGEDHDEKNGRMARICFAGVLEIDPSREDAKQRLLEVGGGCPTCRVIWAPDVVYCSRCGYKRAR